MKDYVPLQRVHSSPMDITSIKSMFILFMLFLFVISDIFTNSILSSVPGATIERNATNIGMVLQGLFLVIFYIMINYLISCDIL